MAKGTGLPDSLLTQVCDVFKLLSDRTRFSILLYLAQQEHNVGQLCAKHALPQPTVSHHLALMRMSRLIQKRRNGKQMIYSISAEGMGAIAGQLLKHLGSGRSATLGAFTVTKKGK